MSIHDDGLFPQQDGRGLGVELLQRDVDRTRNVALDVLPCWEKVHHLSPLIGDESEETLDLRNSTCPRVPTVHPLLQSPPIPRITRLGNTHQHPQGQPPRDAHLALLRKRCVPAHSRRPIGFVLSSPALLALDLGAGPALAGLIVALRGLGTMVFDIPAGVVVSRVGEKEHACRRRVSPW